MTKRILFLTLFLLFGVFLTVFAADKSPVKPNIRNVNIDAELSATKNLETIVLGAGCFWGVEKRYESINGVINAVSGYADGRGIQPNYQAITHRDNQYNPNNFAEVVQITFNPTVVSLDHLLKIYFETHDPTQINRQGNDYGTQYRSTILTTKDSQGVTANNIKSQYQKLLTKAGFGQIVTTIKPLETFYPAEDYHQDYLLKNPNGYCPDNSTGVKFQNTDSTLADINNTELLTGKHILIIDSENYCPYCEKFKRDVINDYQGDIKIHTRLASQLNGLSIKTPTWATPTILFLENGKEKFGHQGYLDRNQFYQVLGAWLLGNSEAYQVAFNAGTDSRFCKQYEIFKNTPDGVFVDKLSGAHLFDTRDRFDSGTGWLSFTRPVKNAVTEHEDNSYGMKRIEIRSKSSGIHLGHVFNDGPNNMPRYCINASVLNFIPRK